jgi:hypothetical protein
VSPVSVVDIMTTYGLDDLGVEVRVLRVKDFNFILSRSAVECTHPPIYGTEGSFPVGKASITCLGPENIDVYVHSPVCLHGVVVN